MSTLNIHDLHMYIGVDVGVMLAMKESICYQEMTETDSKLKECGVAT